MPPVLPPKHIRQMQRMFSDPANLASDISSQANGGISGVASNPNDPSLPFQWNTQAIRFGMLPLWPDPPTKGSAQTQGVGLDVLDPYSGNPVIRMGNISVTLTDGTTFYCAMAFIDDYGACQMWFNSLDGLMFAPNGSSGQGIPGNNFFWVADTTTKWWSDGPNPS